ncbi:MAG: queuosine precursor transporter [Halodesulfurarchaeum sp.]
MNGDRRFPIAQVALVGLFMTALVTAQLTATKILAFPVPASLPVVGSSVILPGASLAIAVMFFTSDCYAELYGRGAAQVLVNVGFAMNFVLLSLVWSTILAPAAPSSVDPSAFATVLGASTNIVIGSLVAYIVSQNFDVIAFHALREFTDGRHLWLRNIGSTATSQAIDTVIFVGVAFFLAPTVLGFGSALPVSIIIPLIIGQYLLKLLIALLDTPVVYLVVGLAGGREPETPRISVD